MTSVEVWFEAADGRSTPSQFTYTARSETGAKVLILSAENYIAGNPAQEPDGPHYLSYYTDALDAIGVAYDVYDVDRRATGRRTPSACSSHYDAVIWYTGDDYLTRQPGQPAGHGHRAPRGRGDDRRPRRSSTRAASCSTRARTPACSTPEGNEFRNFGFPEPDGAPATRPAANVLDPQYCNKNGTDTDRDRRRSNVAGVRRGRPDAGRRVHRAQRRLPPVLPGGVHPRHAAATRVRRGERALPFDLAGTPDGPFAGLTLGLRRDGAGNQDHTATFVVTSSICSTRQRYPLYADRARPPTGCARARRRSARSAASRTWPRARTAAATSG